MYYIQLHKRLEVELDHARGGARSVTGCLLSESSGARVRVQPIQRSPPNYALNYALLHDATLRL